MANAEAIYSGPDGLYDSFSAYHGSSLPTRYVLFRDSTFQLQFASYRFGVFTYHGRYTRTNEAIDFFYGDSSSATWGASGILRGDTLEIRYSPDMSMSDFLDGSYVRVR